MAREVVAVFPSPAPHWVGDGFPARTLFSYDRLGRVVSPFLLLDYAGPAEFPVGSQQRGVGEHPHRGFETVTLVYEGEVSHRDTSGSGGTIGPGGVQWMTAGRGVMHEELHSDSFTRTGGRFKLAQLWVNLPAAHKMTAPRYQGIEAAAIPVVELPEGAGRLRVIAGKYGTQTGPASTFTELNVWDARLTAGTLTLPVPDGHNAIIAVLEGAITLASGEQLGDGACAIYSTAGGAIELTVREPSTLLVMTGVPIDEPIFGYGPFVMNSREEIVAAFDDVNAGRFGHL
ncbi:MAG: pirin family protein [Steroidobacteraceae bacterium]